MILFGFAQINALADATTQVEKKIVPLTAWAHLWKKVVNWSRDLSNSKVDTRTNSGYVSWEVLVKFKGTKLNLHTSWNLEIQSFNTLQKLKTKKLIRGQNAALFELPVWEDVRDAITRLKKDSRVEYVQPNFRYKVNGETSTWDYFDSLNDPAKLELWGLHNTWSGSSQSYGSKVWADIDWSRAMSIYNGSGSSHWSTIVAVIDVWVAYSHPDLEANMWDWSECNDENWEYLWGCQHGFDFVDYDNDPTPYSGDIHWTHVAWTIAASANNEVGIVWVNPYAKIMAIRAWAYGSLTTADIVASIDFAQNNWAKVINASWWWWYTSCDEAFDELVYEAIKRYSWLFVVAAWNDAYNINNKNYFDMPVSFASSTSCWEALDNMITVAATDENDRLASFSNYWQLVVDVWAPGANIYSTTEPGEMSYSTNEVYYENFESTEIWAIPSNFTIHNDINIEDTTPVTSSWWWVNYYWDQSWKGLMWDMSYPYALNTNSTIESNTVDLSGYVGANMYIMTDCDTEYLGMYDYMALEVSSDGTSFNEIERWNESSLDEMYYDSDPTWYASGELSFSLNDYLSSNFKFRFRWVSDSSENEYHWCNVDWIQIQWESSSGMVSSLYQFLDWTSMATPHVAWLVSLIEDYSPSMSNSEVKNLILTSWDSLSALSWATISWKRINAYNALAHLASPAPENVRIYTDSWMTSEIQDGATIPGQKIHLVWDTPQDKWELVQFKIILNDSLIGYTSDNNYDIDVWSWANNIVITGINDQWWEWSVDIEVNVEIPTISNLKAYTSSNQAVELSDWDTTYNTNIYLEWEAPSLIEESFYYEVNGISTNETSHEISLSEGENLITIELIWGSYQSWYTLDTYLESTKNVISKTSLTINVQPIPDQVKAYTDSSKATEISSYSSTYDSYIFLDWSSPLIKWEWASYIFNWDETSNTSTYFQLASWWNQLDVVWLNWEWNNRTVSVSINLLDPVPTNLKLYTDSSMQEEIQDWDSTYSTMLYLTWDAPSEDESFNYTISDSLSGWTWSSVNLSYSLELEPGYHVITVEWENWSGWKWEASIEVNVETQSYDPTPTNLVAYTDSWMTTEVSSYSTIYAHSIYLTWQAPTDWWTWVYYLVNWEEVSSLNSEITLSEGINEITVLGKNSAWESWSSTFFVYWWVVVDPTPLNLKAFTDSWETTQLHDWDWISSTWVYLSWNLPEWNSEWIYYVINWELNDSIMTNSWVVSAEVDLSNWSNTINITWYNELSESWSTSITINVIESWFTLTSSTQIVYKSDIAIYWTWTLKLNWVALSSSWAWVYGSVAYFNFWTWYLKSQLINDDSVFQISWFTSSTWASLASYSSKLSDKESINYLYDFVFKVNPWINLMSVPFDIDSATNVNNCVTGAISIYNVVAGAFANPSVTTVAPLQWYIINSGETSSKYLRLNKASSQSLVFSRTFPAKWWYSIWVADNNVDYSIVNHTDRYVLEWLWYTKLVDLTTPDSNENSLQNTYQWGEFSAMLNTDQIINKSKTQIENEWSIELNLWEWYLIYISDISKDYTWNRVSDSIEWINIKNTWESYDFSTKK